MAKLIHWLAIAACVVVVLGFAGFAADEMRYASNTQQAKLADDFNDPTRGPATERRREKEHSQARELVDDANDILLAPFSGIVEGSGSVWVKRGVPTLLALLTYGLLLLLIANSLPKPKAQSGGDWRTAGSS
ncbi:MAG TPA: hypothetical protein VGF21_13735 [Thermoleophilaceae bacterium]|jgi:hypothetical protein